MDPKVCFTCSRNVQPEMFIFLYMKEIINLCRRVSVCVCESLTSEDADNFRYLRIQYCMIIQADPFKRQQTLINSNGRILC